MGLDLVIMIVLFFLILLGLSAFFSGSEIAYFSLSPSERDAFRSSTNRSEQRVAQLLETPRRLLITIVIGNTIVNITTASVAAIITTDLIHALHLNYLLALFIEIIIVTLVILIVSEIIPKVIAVRNPKSFARLAGPFLKFLYGLFGLLARPLTTFINYLQTSAGFSADKNLLSEEELKTLVEVGEEHGTLEEDEREMIHSIFEFGETTAREIMIPRTDMVCVESAFSMTQIMTLIRTRFLSRIPVYKEHIDNIVGILYIKDLLPILNSKRRNKINLTKLARKAYFVPEQKKIDDLLREFQKERIHMALVVDEYGGISGLVTLEDVIEEIVGEIQDEYDKEQPLFSIIDDYTFVVDGRMSLEEINEQLNLDLPTAEGVETISGFILSLLGALPREKQRTRYNGYQFVVEQMVRNRILKVRIEKDKPDLNVPNEITK